MGGYTHVAWVAVLASIRRSNSTVTARLNYSVRYAMNDLHAGGSLSWAEPAAAVITESDARSQPTCVFLGRSSTSSTPQQ